MSTTIARYIVTEDSERLDRIAEKIYGHTKGSVEALLEANPVAGLGGDLPFGTVLLVPDLPDAEEEPLVRPWQ